MGLFNRNSSVAGAAYSLMQQWDAQWLADLDINTPTLTPIPIFIASCLSSRTADGKLLATGYIRYSFKTQQIIIPNIITLAGVLDAVPFEENDPLIGNATAVFDALITMAGFDALQATSYMLDHYVQQTSTMAFMNPGLDVHAHPANPPLTKV